MQGNPVYAEDPEKLMALVSEMYDKASKTLEDTGKVPMIYLVMKTMKASMCLSKMEVEEALKLSSECCTQTMEYFEGNDVNGCMSEPRLIMSQCLFQMG